MYEHLTFEIAPDYRTDCGCPVSMATCHPSALGDFKAPFVTGMEHHTPGLPMVAVLTHNHDGTVGLYTLAWVYGTGGEETTDEFPDQETAEGYINAIFELKLWSRCWQDQA